MGLKFVGSRLGEFKRHPESSLSGAFSYLLVNTGP
jgi:hypothetical protein